MITIKRLPQPDIRPLGESGDNRYVLKMDYSFSFERDGEFHSLLIPEGFIYDGASIPRWAMMLIGLERDGVHRAAALIHDWLYVHEGEVSNPYNNAKYTYNRYEADKFLLKGMEYHGVKSWHVRLAYLAVRGFGWVYRRF